MPSPEHAADLERVLTRAAQECEFQEGIWFGDGLPQALRVAIEAHGKTTALLPAEIAFVEVRGVSPHGRATTDADTSELRCPVVGLSTSTLHELGSLVRPQGEPGIQITRLICPVAVFDFSSDGIRVREVRHGLTAADLQRELSSTLWCGSDLKELGSH
jgi:acyl CoA:acetate/3-ketoacid CoA transferase beta subunit